MGMLAFKAKVQELEDKFEKLAISYEQGGGKVLPLYLGLFMGILGAIISIMWVLQILIHNILDAHPLLSSMFIAMDSGFTLRNRRLRPFRVLSTLVRREGVHEVRLEPSA